MLSSLWRNLLRPGHSPCELPGVSAGVLCISMSSGSQCLSAMILWDPGSWGSMLSWFCPYQLASHQKWSGQTVTFEMQVVCEQFKCSSQAVLNCVTHSHEWLTAWEPSGWKESPGVGRSQAPPEVLKEDVTVWLGDVAACLSSSCSAITSALFPLCNFLFWVIESGSCCSWGYFFLFIS